MKLRSTLGLGPSLTTFSAAALLCVHLGASALSLGRLTVQSTLGEALRAEIDITSITPEEASAFRASLATPEAFRAAGVDFNAALTGAQAVLVRRPDGRQVIRLTGERAVGEPFLDVVLDFSWNGGRLQRAYTLLIDPPPRTTPPPPPAPTAEAAITPVPVSPPPPPPSPPPAASAPSRPAPVPAASPAASRPALTPPPPAPVAASPAPGASVPGSGYRVRRGDTLSGIAAANGPSGVSLDQMLVSLYRSNPQAFMGNNMNRLKTGVVLSMPQADEANAISSKEARQVIQAHSADFAAFRRQLAGAAPAVKTAEAPREARGKVTAAVEDRKTASAPPAPDKLTLSRGAAASAASASSSVEAKLSKETERKAAEARVAELARNVNELKKLSGVTGPASAASATKASPAVASAASAGLAVPVAAPVVPPVAAASAAAAPATAASKASAASTAAAVASVPASVAASAPAMAASAASEPAPASAPPGSAEESPSGFLNSIVSSPYVLPGAVGLVALLAGLGLMRVRRRSQEAGAETSFLESKLQPDSFFGVTGGKRVDTRDGGNSSSSSSSLSYSLSQLDAIGDVDPVAEADVYLAYGRDLQAEEILKEALRTDPGRAAIRTKLLEVYAKRADAPAFESQALQLRELVGEDGDDWLRAQAMGRELDPGNPLYGVARAPEVDIDTSSAPPADLRSDPAIQQGARQALPDIDKTLPLDEPAATVEGGALDLDIDLESPSRMGALEETRPQDPDQALAGGGGRVADAPREFSLDDDDEADAATPQRDPPVSAPVDFDFGDLSLDLDTPAAAADAAEPVPAAEVVEGDGEVSDDDPLARKLELADEFRRIGDTEGARDLLDEVISQAEGALKAKAQAMLDSLG